MQNLIYPKKFQFFISGFNKIVASNSWTFNQKNITQKSEQFVHISGKSNIASALAIVQFIRQFLYPVVHKDPENSFHQEY